MQYIRWFNEIGIDDVATVGGKNASLGELYQELVPLGVLVPNGFCITAQAYWDLLQENNIRDKLRALMTGVDKNQVEDLAHRGQEARRLIYEARYNERLLDEIRQAYHQLINQYGETISVAVRSSATAEDLPHASFAGQQESYLNVSGDEMLLEMCRHCFASLFTDRAISYRIDHGFDHMTIALSIGVQKMVRADIGASGVMFTLDTETGFRNAVFITGSYGLGENVVQGVVDPDEFYVHKPTFEAGYRHVLRRSLGRKQITMVYATDRTRGGVRNIPTPRKEQESYCLTDKEVLTLADYAIKVEQHYSKKHGKDMPMDMEWAKDGSDQQLYLVQARPETVTSQAKTNMLEEYVLGEKSVAILEGRSVGSKIAAGQVHIIHDVSKLPTFRSGEVLVADITTPDWEPVMKKAAAIVTNRGGRTCHAAIVARELGVPAVVGTENATDILNDGQWITVSCAEGIAGYIYDGRVPYEITRTDLGKLKRPRTLIMMNVGNPEMAFKASMIPNDGVGLARLEFVIGNSIKAHPMALLNPDKLDQADQQRLTELTRLYKNGEQYYIEKLSEGVATIAAAFYPKPVIVRLSDFKSNEYAAMLGGKYFEPEEENPMLGFRGAVRYIDPEFSAAFALECRALFRVREEMGFNNIKLMVPFCRTVEEGAKVLDALSENGLVQGKNNLEIYVMCEIPNNVIQIDEFAKHFDGFSIGSNDLTQLVLGVDRDSTLVSKDFDERNPGVLEMIRMTIEGAKRNNKPCGICGQAPSDFPEIAEFVVRAGIDSISLSPDTVLRTTRHILSLEKKS